MAKKRRSSWEKPEIEDWYEDEIDWNQEPNTRYESERQLLPFVLGLGLGFSYGCYPRRHCYPRYYGCRPRWYCYPRLGCYPRPCYPI